MNIIGEDESKLRNLPPEVLNHVFKFLTLSDKKIARTVCRRWCFTLDDPKFMNYSFNLKIGNEYNENDSFGFVWNSTQTIENLTLTALTKDFPPMTATRNKFPVIRNATILQGNSGRNVFVFLQYGCDFLESLTINNNALHGVDIATLPRVIPQLKWSQLCSLQLNIRNTFRSPTIENKTTRHQMTAVAQILKLATIPQLKNLSLQFGATIEDYQNLPSLEPIQTMFSEMYGFIGRHTGSLKSLKLDTTDVPLQVYKNHTLDVSMELQENILKNLELDMFEFEDYTENWDEEIKLILPCLLMSGSISKLICRTLWSEHNGAFPNEYVQLVNMICRNANSLLELNIICSSLKAPCLKPCIHLKKLSCGPWLRDLDEADTPIPTLEYMFVYNHIGSPVNLYSWILRNFRNLKTLKFEHEYGQRPADDLQRFSALPSIRQIYMYGLRGEEIREFCSQNPKVVRITSRNHPFWRAEQLGGLIYKEGNWYFQLNYPDLLMFNGILLPSHLYSHEPTKYY